MWATQRSSATAGEVARPPVERNARLELRAETRILLGLRIDKPSRREPVKAAIRSEAWRFLSPRPVGPSQRFKIRWGFTGGDESWQAMYGKSQSIHLFVVCLSLYFNPAPRKKPGHHGDEKGGTDSNGPRTPLQRMKAQQIPAADKLKSDHLTSLTHCRGG